METTAQLIAADGVRRDDGDMAHDPTPARRWTISEKLNAWLSDRGLSVNAFAKQSGIGQTTLNGWANGKRSPNLAGLRRLAKATGMPPAYWSDEAVPIQTRAELRANVERDIEGIAGIPVDLAKRLAAELSALRTPADVRRVIALLKAARSR